MEDNENTEFTDLNDDCLYIIFKHLDGDDLLNLPRVSEQFFALAIDIFRLKYSHLQTVINDGFRLPNNSTELLNVAGMQIDSDAIDRVNALYCNNMIYVWESSYCCYLGFRNLLVKTTATEGKNIFFV